MKLDELTSETSEAKTIHSNGTSNSDLKENIKEKPIEADKSDEIKNGGDEMDLLIEDVNATKQHLHDDDSRHQTGDQANDDCASSSSSSNYQSIDEIYDDQSQEMTLRLTDDEEEDDLVKNGEPTKDKIENELSGIFEQYKKDSMEYSAKKPSNKIWLTRNLEDTDNEDETPDVKKSNISLKRNIEYEYDDKPDEKDLKKPKIKLNESEKPKVKEVFVSLQLFRDFMEKNEIKVLSRADLEAFSLQKMCEVFNEKSKCAELVRIVKKQQQAIDSLRQKYASAEEQIRHMNIVHGKVLAEIRTKLKEHGTAKDVQPIKFTRSVGLQVCMPPVAVRNIKPSASDVTPQSNFQQSPAQQQQQPTQTRRIQRNNSINRQQTTPPTTRPGPASSKVQPQQQRGAGGGGGGIKTPKTPESKTSSSTNGQILGNYFQQRSATTPSPQAATRKPITAQPQQQQQPVATPINNAVEKASDLTDEDDRPATTNNTPSTTTTMTNETTNNSNSNTTNTLSVILPKQQSDAVVTISMPRLTDLVSSTPGQLVHLPTLKFERK